MARRRTLPNTVCRLLWVGLVVAGTAQAQDTTDTAHALQQADAFVRTVFEQRDSSRYDAAAHAYLSLLTRLDGELPADLHALRTRHLAPLALILPDDEQAAMGLTTATAATGPPEGTGAALAAWWRRMDPLPATPEHERLAEHLERVAYAVEHFRDDEAAAGFDDRGVVYVRLGPPGRKQSVSFIDATVAGVSSLDHLTFPKNEFWVYRDVDETAHYLFVQHRRDQGYRIDLPHALLPPELRYPRNAPLLLATLEALYRDLALWHQRGHYGLLYDRIAAYTNQQTEGTTRPPGSPSPRSFAQTTLSRTRSADERAARQRDAQTPTSYSNVLDDLEDLPVAVRYARFLDPDGTTRTELYWGVPTRQLPPSRRRRDRLRKEGYQPSAAYALDVTLAQQTDAYETRARTHRRHLVLAPPDEDDGVIPAQSSTARGDTGRYHLALQWDVFWATEDKAPGIPTGPKLKVGVHRLDTLRALQRDPARLEMSDLKPLRVADGAALPEAAPPYPHAALTPATRLALYFEVYHLRFDADDQTHYRVAYEITRRPGKDRTRLTTAQTRYTGDSRTARESIFLDLGDLADTDHLDVTVRVTDVTTGEHVARSLHFDVQQ